MTSPLLHHQKKWKYQRHHPSVLCQKCHHHLLRQRVVQNPSLLHVHPSQVRTHQFWCLSGVEHVRTWKSVITMYACLTRVHKSEAHFYLLPIFSCFEITGISVITMLCSIRKVKNVLSLKYVFLNYSFLNFLKSTFLICFLKNSYKMSCLEILLTEISLLSSEAAAKYIFTVKRCWPINMLANQFRAWINWSVIFPEMPPPPPPSRGSPLPPAPGPKAAAQPQPPPVVSNMDPVSTDPDPLNHNVPTWLKV